MALFTGILSTPDPSDPRGNDPRAVKGTNLTWSAGGLSREERFGLLGCRGATVWFTGLSASGKSTIAAALEAELLRRRVHAYRLDGDNIRMGLNRNLGFSGEDRAENIRRIGEVSRLFADSGCVALTSFISPYRGDRAACRAMHESTSEGGAGGGALPFIEVFVDTPIEVCEARDPKGLYKKARAGQIRDFTGIDAPYEAPERPEIVLRTAEMDVGACVGICVKELRERGVIA